MTHSSLCLPFIILSVLKIRIDLLLSPVCSVLSHTLKKQSKDSNENSFILLMKRNLYAFVLEQAAHFRPDTFRFLPDPFVRLLPMACPLPLLRIIL